MAMVQSEELGNRIFHRLIAMFGAQKVRTMWDGSGDLADAQALWGAAIVRYPADSIDRALAALVASGAAWPPTLPEFSELCRQASLARANGANTAITHQRGPVSDVARSALLEIKRGQAQLDPLFWAKRPASAKAVEFIAIGARTDPRLADILAAHLADPDSAPVREGHPRAAEARRALQALARARSVTAEADPVPA